MAVKTIAQSPSKILKPHRWPPPQGEWTYDDYARLPDNGMRYEVIEGELYMSPAPRPNHQRAIVALLRYFLEYLQQHPVGEILISPIDVNLPGLAGPVQPDLIFITHDRRHIVKEKFIQGTPNLIVEVLSPSNPTHDRNTKFQLYARAGVQEYWLVDCETRTIDIYVLRGQAYALLGSFGPAEEAHSELLVDFVFPAGKICPI